MSWTWNKTLPPPKRLTQKVSPSLDKIVASLKKRRVIEKAKKLLWQSRLFTVPKKESGEERLILDLSILNSFIKCPTFKMLTLKEVKLLLPKNCWTVSIDLKDGFWHIAIAKTKRPYLGFSYRNVDYQFRAMPFGLNVAPRAFTKVIAHVIKVMAEAGIWCLPYLDDLLIIAKTKEECTKHVQLAIKILESLGWIMNYKKSRLEPSQIFEWLGIQFNLVTHTAQASLEKTKCLQKKLREVINSDYCSKRIIMQLQGQANWIGQSDPLVRLMLSVTRNILKTFKRLPLDAPLQLNRGMKLALCRWITDSSIPQALGNPAPDLIVQTDAQPEGWGFMINKTQFSGDFDKTMTYSINILELLTVWFSLLMIRKKGVTIHIKCDNEVAVSLVRKGKSTNPHLSALADLIWRRATLLNWTLSISHIKGSFNVIADQLSRKVALSTEWSLPPEVFQQILDRNKDLQVDLFATSLNYQLDNYMSPCPDKDAVAVDALATPWDQWSHLYIYPPTKLISKVLAKLKTTQFISAVLVTPDTPTRPWYMALMTKQVPSMALETGLQQLVNGTLTKSMITKLRVWQLSEESLKESIN